MNSGIYSIKNKINGISYIGRANDITRRWYRHITNLNTQIHDNIHLQRAYNKYGKESFEFSVLEYAEINKLQEIEQKYLDIAKQSPNLYYNKNYNSNGGNGKHTEEWKKMMSEKNKGKNKGIPLSDETKAKLKLARKERVGYKAPSFDHTIYKFINTKTNVTETCTRYDLCIKYNFTKSDKSNLASVINGYKSHHKGWKINL